MEWARLKSCSKWGNVCVSSHAEVAMQQVSRCVQWRQGRRRNVSRKAKLPEVSIAAMWASHINSKTRAGQKTSFDSCYLIFLNCWQYKNLAFQLLVASIAVYFILGDSLSLAGRWAPGMYPPTFPSSGEIHGMSHGCESLDSCPYACLASTFLRPCDVPSLRDCWLLGELMKSFCSSFPRLHGLSQGF